MQRPPEDRRSVLIALAQLKPPAAWDEDAMRTYVAKRHEILEALRADPTPPSSLSADEQLMADTALAAGRKAVELVEGQKDAVQRELDEIRARQHKVRRAMWREDEKGQTVSTKA